MGSPLRLCAEVFNTGVAIFSAYGDEKRGSWGDVCCDSDVKHAQRGYGTRAASMGVDLLRVVVQFGVFRRNPKRERGRNALPRLRFGL